MSRLVLIDGHAILHRAFHALPPMKNSAGQPTNAVYGFVAILLRVIEELKPTHMAVVFDMPGGTFRNEVYKEYQSQRPAMDMDLRPQVKSVHEVVEALQIPIFESDGYEADDLIGTLASKTKQIDEVIIVTGDRDLLQLVNKKVKLFMPVKGLSEAKIYDAEAAKERMGVMPDKIVDLKALMGDPSDNYPGVDGIGPKTAISLLTQFGSVERIYKHLKDIKNQNLAAKLEKGRDSAFISQKLAQVVLDAPVKLDLETAKLPEDFLTEKVIETFGKFEFRTLLKRLTKLNGKDVEEAPKKEVKKKIPEEQMGLF
jgi:DNA polymerase-1